MKVARANTAAWVILGIVLGAASALLLLRHTSAVSLFGLRAHTTITDSTVVREIRNLQRLESVVYTLDQIVTSERTYNIVPPSLAGDRILLIVHGDVTAGIDLGQVRTSDIQVAGKSIHVHMPKAQVFSTRLDNEKTRVYSRDTGVFSNPDPQLESEARRHAESQLTAAALQDGILDTATRNATSTLTTLLHSLGFDSVSVD
ncbi:MAG: hypothetical protein NVS9B15_11810 [Acidobacteriaceae bacterium]